MSENALVWALLSTVLYRLFMLTLEGVVSMQEECRLEHHVDPVAEESYTIVIGGVLFLIIPYRKKMM
jgi:hypothetical protein